MNCKEFEKKVPDFISHKMDFLALQEFSEHMEHCEICKEELSIQFLVMEGMQSLEDGDVFDLQTSLNKQLLDAKRKMRFHNSFLRMGFILEVFAVIAAAGAVIWILV